MKKFKLLVLIVLLLAPFNLANSNDVYFINLKKVLNESKAGSDAQSKLLKEFESKDKKFKGESDALKKQETELITQKKTLSPEDYKKNVEIENISNLKKSSESFLFHAGTLIKDEKIYSVGGRVLNFVSTNVDLYNARKKILAQIYELNWNEGFFRKDIGFKAIDN